MRYTPPRSLNLILGAVLFLAPPLASYSVAAVPGDPVEELRQVLPIRLEDMRNPTKAVLDYRRATLQDRIAKLRTIGDLRQALSLREWKEELFIDEKLRTLDNQMRSEIGQRLRKALVRIASSPDPNSRLAAANLIAEIGPSIRALDPNDPNYRRGYAASLLDIVIDLARDDNLAVRLEALRALGTINANPQKAVPVLKRFLSQGELRSRRVAAYSLGQIIRVVNHLQKRKAGVEATPNDFIDAASQVVLASQAGIDDSDVQVRALSVEAADVAADALAVLISDPLPENRFPPPGRPLSPDELQRIKQEQATVKKEIRELAAVVAAFRTINPMLVQAIQDPAPIVRLEGITSLENIAYVRKRIRDLALSVPAISKKTAELPPLAWPSDYSVDPLAPFLKNHLDTVPPLLADKGDRRIRRVTVDFLERIEEAADPLLLPLAKRLRDPDRFVRWAAARTLGGILPQLAPNDGPGVAVALDGLAHLQKDLDVDVRMAAAQTLEAVGPPASPTVGALAHSARFGDAVARLQSLEALESVGVDRVDAKTLEKVVLYLIDSLQFKFAPDERVRADAAHTLGSFANTLRRPENAELKRLTVAALRKALGDDNDEVRANASDAMLNLLEGFLNPAK